ncbi:MAG: DNA-binding protein [Chitinophagaceae bacterium]|nr:MAG: DNA-binding protein [Chitinophagaceae bacterium]
MNSKNEIILYQSDELPEHIEVRLEDETIWLTQQQIVELFESSKANISEHIKHIFESGELIENSTVRNFRIVRMEGNREVSRELQHYSLDVIISVGYRVNSKRGTQFRIWANQVLKDHLLKGYSIAKRIDRIEENVQGLIGRVSEIDVQINASLPPKQGIFYDGQVFDAYVFVANLVKSAKKSILLIDNYIDESVLELFTKRHKQVTVKIYTKTISKTLKQDVEKHNAQYPYIEIEKFTKAHDRFLIIDECTVYHFGASLKDLGKKWFAFSKMNSMTKDIIRKLKKGGDDE